MAYAAIVSLTRTLEIQLLPPNQHLFGHHQKQQRKDLHAKATILLEFLENSSQNIRLRVEEKIRDAAYEAEDIVDSQMSDQFEYSSLKRWMKNCLRDRDLTKVISLFDSIIQQVKSIKENLTPRNSLPVVLPPQPAYTAKTTMVGLEDDLMQIKERIMGSQSSQFEVIPIVGMGGIGKTTLATSLYNHPDTRSHFPKCGWVTVSQTYSVRQILLGILESMKELTEELRRESNDNRLSEHLYQTLMKTARYLIVLDDVWDRDVWDAIGRIFPKGNNGSRIILTTQLRDVADYASTNNPPHEMQLLSEEGSWCLLCENAFRGKDCPPELEEPGRRIARSCKGLPLDIVVIGGVLSKLGRTLYEWENLADRINSMSTLTSDVDQCLAILSLSYDHLPQHLKACFLYMGCFPEDHEITVSKLISLWSAEGFLKQVTSGDLDQIAERNVEELVERSLILVRKKKLNGKIKTCGVHDKVRNLCLTVARKEKFLCFVNKPRQQFPYQIRRVSFLSGDLIAQTTGLSFCRSVLCPDWLHLWDNNSFPSLRLLRILDLSEGEFYEFPDEITQLIHLRYLLIPCYCPPPPESITKLRNVQTLIISPLMFDEGFYVAGVNQYGIWKMQQLQHLDWLTLPLSYPVDLQSRSQRPALLKNLRTLYWVEVSKCSKEVLEEIPNLRKLGIRFKWDVNNEAAYNINNLVLLQHLEKLKCKSEEGFKGLGTNFWENLAFPKTLAKLTLENTRILWTQMRIVGSLPNLQVLRLKREACAGHIWEPGEGEFPQLNALLIDEVSDLKEWKAESTHFPNLQRLILKYCKFLKRIPNGIGDIPTIQTIELHCCSISVKDSAREIQREQEEFGNSLHVVISERNGSKWGAESSKYWRVLE